MLRTWEVMAGDRAKDDEAEDGKESTKDEVHRTGF